MNGNLARAALALAAPSAPAFGWPASPPPPPPAETYALAAAAPCRAIPAADARVVANLRVGESVTVLADQGEWRKVRAGGSSCWIKHSVAFSDAQARPGAQAAAQSSRPSMTHHHSTSATRHHVAMHHRVRHHTARSTYGGGCPCSGSHICIGPRGGRYCITSGGNKRYGV